MAWDRWVSPTPPWPRRRTWVASESSPPSPFATVDAESKLAFDNSNGPHRGRLLLAYTDAPSVASNDLNIFVIHSDDNGVT